jgi:D-sedoheptulose 7-phosphate isomerase
MFRDRIQSALQEGLQLRSGWLEQTEKMEACAREMAAAINAGGTIFFAGNGGSAADSQHLATELVVRLSAERERRALPGLALTTDSSLITACSNDYSYEQIFARQIEALGKPQDLLVALSTSGNSGNVVAAAKAARVKGMKILGLLGGTGGRLLELCDNSLVVASGNPGRVQEMHITFGHILIDLVEEILFP